MSDNKILFYLNNPFPRVGGGEAYQWNIIRSLKKFNFVIYANAHDENDNIEEIGSNLIIKHFPKDLDSKPCQRILNKIILELRTFVSKNRSLKKERFDILHVHGASFYSCLLWLEKKIKIPFYKKLNQFDNFGKRVVTLHNCFPAFTKDKYLTRAYNSYIDSFPNIICVDKHIFDYVSHYCSINLLNRNIWFIPNSVDTEIFSSICDKKNGSFTVGFAGRMAPTVDYRLINEIIDKAPPNMQFKLAVSGDTSLLRDKQNVEINCNVGQNEMPNFYSKLSILINPILHKAISRVTLESMACGVPVMMYNYTKRSPHFTELNGIEIDDNANNVLNKIHEFRKRTYRRQTMGKNARSVIETYYSNTVILPKIEKIYYEMMNEKSISANNKFLTSARKAGKGKAVISI